MLFKSLPESAPFLKFQDFYLRAEDAGQPFTEAGCISSVDQDGAPHGRYVNFKYFFEDKAIPTIPYQTARFALSWPESPPSDRMNRTAATT